MIYQQVCISIQYIEYIGHGPEHQYAHTYSMIVLLILLLLYYYTVLLLLNMDSPSGVFLKMLRIGDTRSSRRGKKADTGIQHGPKQITVMFTSVVNPKSVRVQTVQCRHKALPG